MNEHCTELSVAFEMLLSGVPQPEIKSTPCMWVGAREATSANWGQPHRPTQNLASKSLQPSDRQISARNDEGESNDFRRQMADAPALSRRLANFQRRSGLRLKFFKSSKSMLGMAIALREFRGVDHTHSRLHAATPQMKINEKRR